MASQQDASEVICFAEFQANRRTRELRRDGVRVRLPDQSFQILLMLLQQPGELVTREEIRKRLWSADTFVDFDHGLNNAVKRLRDALEDAADAPRYIETLPRRGYRFLGTMERKGNGADTRSMEAVDPQSGSGKVQRLSYVAIASLLLLTVLAGAWVWRNGSGKPRIRSIAVLPFDNLSGDKNQDYFADGMTDELITMLAKDRDLRVISRTSVMRYKTTQRALPEIARELGVDGILEGSVARNGNRVHVRAQLINARTDSHVWAESYDRDESDIISLQREVAQSIAQQVGLRLTVPPAERKIDPEAHEAYLRGRHYWFAEGYDRSREEFQRAIDIQPDYAAAWSGLSDSYLASGVSGSATPEQVMPLGEAAARKAVGLDDTLAEAHNSLAAAYFFYRWDWQNAERESSRALDLNPSLSEAHHLRGYILRAMNRSDDDLREQKASMTLDPFARPWAVTWALIGAGRYDEAIQEGRLRSAALPGDVVLHAMLTLAYQQKDMQKEAAAEWERILVLLNRQKDAAELRSAFDRGGMKAVYEWDLANLKKRAAAKHYVSPLDFAKAFSRLRRKDEAIAQLERAYAEHMPFIVHLQTIPEFAILHSDPRYQAIVKKIGLPPRSDGRIQ